MSKVVIVTGSRDWSNAEIIDRALAEEKPDLVVQGGARGADAIAWVWATSHKVPCRTVKAEWLKFGKIAGAVRNEAMLKAYPEATVLAFPLGGPGTRDCIARAHDKGMKLRVFGGHDG